jgi:hypothetical protein
MVYVVDSWFQGYFQGISHFGDLGCEIHYVFECEVIIHRNTVFFPAEIRSFSCRIQSDSLDN